MIELLLNSINNPIILGVLVYTYLIYTLFLNDEKFKVIPNLEELFKVGFLFVGIFILTIPLIVYLPATVNLLEGKPLPMVEDFDILGLLVAGVIFTFLPWMMKNSSKRFNIQTWLKMINFLNLIFLILLILAIVISYIPSSFNEYEFIRLPAMAMSIIFGIVVILESFYISLIPKMLGLKNVLEEEKQRNKNRNNVKNKMKKSFWRALWEPEDARLFGELFMILGGFLIIKWADIITPSFQGKEWLYFGIGFLFILYGVKLLRKEENSKKNGTMEKNS